MKVFLMYRDRDFLPAPARPDEPDRFSLAYRDRESALKQTLTTRQRALVQDLELNTLFAAMARGDGFLLDIARKAVLAGLDDPDTICYRQDILRDCLKNGDAVRALYQIPIQSTQNKRRSYMGIYSSHPGGILSSAVELLAMFIGLLRDLRRIADEHADRFESEGFRRFFAMIAEELDDGYFAEVDAHLRALRFRDGVLLGAALGRGNEGADYVLRRPPEKKSLMKRVLTQRSPVYRFSLNPRDEHGARALGELRDRGINLVANAVAQSADHIDSFLKMLQNELAFYVGCLNLQEQLAQWGEPIAFPAPAESRERRHSFVGLYDACLALTMQKRVVGNDANADEKDLFIVTGANQGGKSTFLRSIGLAQVMMQCGMFVPAEGFSANISGQVFTHYKREEDTTMKSGKLDEELARMSAIVDKIAPDDMILFNESFSATNEREGSEIARQVVRALLEKRVKVFFVTHQYEFAHSMYDRSGDGAIFLRAERLADGTRTFKLVQGEPLQTSFGRDLYDSIFAWSPTAGAAGQGEGEEAGFIPSGEEG